MLEKEKAVAAAVDMLTRAKEGKNSRGYRFGAALLF